MRNRKAFTLVEMLVVIAIISILAGMLTGVIIYARNLAIRAECQQNLNHIGQTVSLLVLSNNGLYPKLTDAYPTQQASDGTYQPINAAFPWNNEGFPWWARVFEQWKDLGTLYAKNPINAPTNPGAYATYTPALNTLDAALNPDGHQLIPNLQMPREMSAFHCRMAGELDGSSAANLFNSISYGINFDVKDYNGLPYCASSNTSPYSPDFPNILTANDRLPDQYRSTEIQNPSQFILISEASAQGFDAIAPPFPQPLAWNSATPYIAGNIVSYNDIGYTCILAPVAGPHPLYPPTSPTYWKPGYWTGGRINLSYYPSGTGYQRLSGDVPPNNAPIVGRHSGYANVLFADYHVEAVQITSVPGQIPSASLNINYDYSKWLLPGK
ncbi:MAG: prepilin-type N-terminal cleavage/methylation domain-containing protein [Candidatus Brocadiia bacterium]